MINHAPEDAALDLGLSSRDSAGVIVALNKRQAAKAAGVSERTVSNWLRAGLPYAKPGGPGGRVLIDPDDLRRWLRGYRIVADATADVAEPGAERGRR